MQRQHTSLNVARYEGDTNADAQPETTMLAHGHNTQANARITKFDVRERHKLLLAKKSTGQK